MAVVRTGAVIVVFVVVRHIGGGEEAESGEAERREWRVASGECFCREMCTVSGVCVACLVVKVVCVASQPLCVTSQPFCVTC